MNQKGISLVEVVIAIAIIGFITSMAIGTYYKSENAQSSEIQPTITAPPVTVTVTITPITITPTVTIYKTTESK